MSNLQIKNLPDDLHARIRERSAHHGLSMRDYVLRLIERDIRRPTVDEWFERLAGRDRAVRGGISAAELIGEAREERDRQLLATLKRSAKPGGETGARSGR